MFTETSAREKLLKHFEVKNLKGFGVEHLKNGIIASGAILQYLIMTQHTQIGHVTSLARIEEDKYVRLDKFTVRSLELMGSMNDGGSSLLNVIDKTISPMGARLLKRWLVFPLKDCLLYTSLFFVIRKIVPLFQGKGDGQSIAPSQQCIVS